MVIYRRATDKEIPDIIDFINMVFSMAHSPHNFQEMLPKLYSPGKERNSRHYLALEDGRIRAVVCTVPTILCHRGKTLTCTGIGSVSVHPYYRQKGYMRKLMEMAVSDMRTDGTALSFLSGRRHRYQHYGYEKGGTGYTFRILKDAFRHRRKDFPVKNLTAAKIESPSDPCLPLVYSLYQKRSVYCDRSQEDFYAVCQGWGHHLYAVFEGTVFCGYFSICNNNISEIVLADPKDLFSCLECCQQIAQEKELILHLSPWESEYIQGIEGLYESCCIFTDDNYQIFDYCKVLDFFMGIQAEIRCLKDGTLDFSVAGEGNFRITVKEGNPEVQTLNKTPSPVLTPFQVISSLFSPDPCPRDHLLPECYNWFPLPLSLCALDKC